MALMDDEDFFLIELATLTHYINIHHLFFWAIISLTNSAQGMNGRQCQASTTDKKPRHLIASGARSTVSRLNGSSGHDRRLA